MAFTGFTGINELVMSFVLSNVFCAQQHAELCLPWGAEHMR